VHLYNIITNNSRIVHTNNLIHFLKKEIPFLAVWLSRRLVFLMGLQYLHIQDPFPPCNSFFTQPNKLLVSHASMYIYLYSKPCILTVHHIYINIKMESHSLPMPHFNIPNLSKRNSTFQRILTNVPIIHGHIHTQCTLALFFQVCHTL
jgi:hypothetical protein